MFVCFELRDTRILQGSTGKKVSIIGTEGKKIPFPKCEFASDFSKFFAFLPLILDWQVSMVIGKQKTNQATTKSPRCYETQKAVNPEKVPALLLEPPWAF